MAISKDPTRTASIEKRWNREITRRWKLFESDVLKALAAKSLVTNAMDMDAEQIRVFMAYYSAKVDELLLGTAAAPNWQASYQLRSYERAIERGRAALRAQGVALAPTIDEVAQAQAIISGQLTAASALTFGTSAEILSLPVHQDALLFLYTRSYESLKSWTDKMTTETRQILTSGVRQGLGIDDISKQLIDRISVSESRARVIARTETIQAYQKSSINQASLLNEELGEEAIRLRWLTSLRGNVRHLHAGWHGELMTPKEADKNSDISPYNCVCSLSPVTKEGDTEKKQQQFAKERKELLKLEAQKLDKP